MAEIAAIASIVGIIAAGSKLSIALFDFANFVGSAGQEIRQIGTEISLFCAVLKQLHSTLMKAKSSRHSVGAFNTTSEILERCQMIFLEIETIIERLKKPGDKAGEVTVDVKARVKWTFKRSQVQLLRTTLESCKITLHIMLTTLDFAEKIANRRTSTVETAESDKEDQVITQSLILAQQSTIEKMEELETNSPELILDDLEKVLPESGPRTSAKAETLTLPTNVRRKRESRLFTYRESSFVSDVHISKPHKRASVWASELLLDTDTTSSTWESEALVQLSLNSKRLSILSPERQTKVLVSKWTDQSDRLDELKMQEKSTTPRNDDEPEPQAQQLLPLPGIPLQLNFEEDLGLLTPLNPTPEAKSHARIMENLLKEHSEALQAGDLNRQLAIWRRIKARERAKEKGSSRVSSPGPGISSSENFHNTVPKVSPPKMSSESSQIGIDVPWNQVMISPVRSPRILHDQVTHVNRNEDNSEVFNDKTPLPAVDNKSYTGGSEHDQNPFYYKARAPISQLKQVKDPIPHPFPRYKVYLVYPPSDSPGNDMSGGITRHFQTLAPSSSTQTTIFLLAKIRRQWYLNPKSRVPTEDKSEFALYVRVGDTLHLLNPYSNPVAELKQRSNDTGGMADFVLKKPLPHELNILEVLNRLIGTMGDEGTLDVNAGADFSPIDTLRKSASSSNLESGTTSSSIEKSTSDDKIGHQFDLYPGFGAQQFVDARPAPRPPASPSGNSLDPERFYSPGPPPQPPTASSIELRGAWPSGRGPASHPPKSPLLDAVPASKSSLVPPASIAVGYHQSQASSKYHHQRANSESRPRNYPPAGVIRSSDDTAIASHAVDTRSVDIGASVFTSSKSTTKQMMRAALAKGLDGLADAIEKVSSPGAPTTVPVATPTKVVEKSLTLKIGAPEVPEVPKIPEVPLQKGENYYIFHFPHTDYDPSVTLALHPQTPTIEILKKIRANWPSAAGLPHPKEAYGIYFDGFMGMDSFPLVEFDLQEDLAKRILTTRVMPRLEVREVVDMTKKLDLWIMNRKIEELE